MSQHPETVIAGSSPFAAALLPHLEERLGATPGVAPDLEQAAALLRGGALVVVELRTPAWFRALQRLAAERPGLRMVAALPRGAEAAVAPLKAIGAEVVRHEEGMGGLLAAVDRALGLPAPAIPAAPGPAPEEPGAPAASPPGLEVPSAPPPANPRPVSAPVAEGASAAVDDVADPGPVGPGEAEDVEEVEEVSPPAAAAPPSAGASSLPPWSPSGPWPASVPGFEVAEEALLAGLDRTPPPYPPLAAVALAVADQLSDLEVKAIARAPLPMDGGPLRRGAVMRLRVAFALASAPPRGAQADDVAVRALLGEIDGLLSEVTALSAAVPEELRSGFDAARSALVKEAIDFSEAAQRYVAVARPAAPPAAPGRPTSSRVRVISDAPVSAEARRAEGRQRGAWLLLAACVVAGGLYHGWSFAQRAPAAPPAIPGLPEGAMGARGADGAVRTLVARPGETLDEATLERFRAEERARGRRVVEVAPGVFSSMPAPDGKPEGP